MDGGGGDAGLVRAGLAAVTLTSGLAGYRAATTGDVGSAAFVAVSYAALLLLFRGLRAYERLPPGLAPHGRRQGRLRREVWALSTLLTVLFAWKVAAAMPSRPAAAAVWTMAAATTVGGFIALFHSTIRDGGTPHE